MAEGFAGSFKGTTIRITSGSSQPLAGEVAIGEGTYTISGATGPDGKPMTMNGRYLNTLRKQGSKYLIAANAAFVPQPPGPNAKGATD